MRSKKLFKKLRETIRFNRFDKLSKFKREMQLQKTGLQQRAERPKFINLADLADDDI